MSRTTILLLVLMTFVGKQAKPLSSTAPLRTVQAESSSRRTVWDGVYTVAQASRGKVQYDANCTSCHGDIQSGNRVELLKGNEFMQRWREDNLESLFNFLKSSMPPLLSRPGNFETPSDEVFLGIMAYMLQANGFPTGSQELDAKSLKNVQIEGKDGPKPLATSTLVQVVGCLTMREELDGIAWMLTRASEPARTRNSDAAISDELKNANDKPLGTLSFRLQNLGYLGSAFNPNIYNSYKMYAKGVLIRQPGSQRLDITFLTMVDSVCVN
jgi:hypothetical protein